MSLNRLDALLIEQSQDIYSAEQPLVKAIPKMAKAACTAEPEVAFAEHTTQTVEHVSRLERVFEELGAAKKTRRCPAIDGLIQEAAEMMEEEGSPEVIDAGLIASAPRVEHYEMAADGNIQAFAEVLGLDDVVALFEGTLHEQHGANNLRSAIPIDIVVPSALAIDDESTEDEKITGASGKAADAARAARPRKLPTSGQTQ